MPTDHRRLRAGFDRIQGALKNTGYHIADSTVPNVLKAHGIEPAPDRQRTPAWSTFLKAHWDSIFATDFTTVEVWTGMRYIAVKSAVHFRASFEPISGSIHSVDARAIHNHVLSELKYTKRRKEMFPIEILPE